MGLVKFTGLRTGTRNWYQRASAWLLVLLIAMGLGSCNRPEIQTTLLLDAADGPHQAVSLQGKLSEVSPPDSLQALKPFLDLYEPQLQILSPREGATLTDTTVTVQVQVRDFPIYKDADLGLGPHFHLALDDQPGQDVYDPDATISFDSLAPGTHTLRAFAARPWHESFKNEGAFDQVTFNVFTTSSNNNAGHNTPLLTYSQPQGIYGAEPLLLDFYLTHVPLHLIAAQDESLSDWRIRCTVNGESFVFDRWQPLYLKGFNPGQNWVKLELIDETGQLFPGPFNSAIGVVEYRPGETDPLSKLIRGEIPVDIARVLVDPTYEAPTPAAATKPSLDDDILSSPESEEQIQDAGENNKEYPAERNSDTQPEPLAADRLEAETKEEAPDRLIPQANVMSPDDESNPEPVLPPDSAEPIQPLQGNHGQAPDELTPQSETISNPNVAVEQETLESDVSNLVDTAPASPVDLNMAGDSEAGIALPDSPTPIDLQVDAVEAIQDNPEVESFDEAAKSASAVEEDAIASDSTTDLEKPKDSEMLVPNANQPDLLTIVE